VFAAYDSRIEAHARWLAEDTVEIGFLATAHVVRRDTFIRHRREHAVARDVLLPASDR
jgi:hypothetical protein